MKRFDISDPDHESDPIEMEENRHGDYVQYQDVVNVIQAIRCAMNQRHPADRIAEILEAEGL